MSHSHHILAYYIFTPIADPHLEVVRHKEFLKDKDIRCRIYISDQGINGQMSATAEASKHYQEWLKSDPRFSTAHFKIHYYHDHAFPRTTVKCRPLLAVGSAQVDMSLTGEHLSPQAWKEMLQKKDEHTVLIDTRNDYEWAIGHFDGSDLPNLETFKEFPQYARELKKKVDPKKTTIMMCCTGGIRCELYSALMKQEGFEKVYQLDGGIINYGLQMGDDLWHGKLFVFDDRLAVPIGKRNEVISRCAHCHTLSDVYYNCANVDCNQLFLSCPACAEKLKGCCSEACTHADRLREYEKTERPKPFRRLTPC